MLARSAAISTSQPRPKLSGSCATREAIWTRLHQSNLSTEASAKKWIEEGVVVFGGIDLLYNNASAPRFGRFDAMAIEDWDFTIRNELDIV
jgi:NAD(P)-dependent dehydrogenase (short-subunit alcohol dehydrogenase family)